MYKLNIVCLSFCMRIGKQNKKIVQKNIVKNIHKVYEKCENRLEIGHET